LSLCVLSPLCFSLSHRAACRIRWRSPPPLRRPPCSPPHHRPRSGAGTHDAPYAAHAVGPRAVIAVNCPLVWAMTWSAGTSASPPTSTASSTLPPSPDLALFLAAARPHACLTGLIKARTDVVGWKGRGLADIPVLIMGRVGRRGGGTRYDERTKRQDAAIPRPELVRVVSSLPLSSSPCCFFSSSRSYLSACSSLCLRDLSTVPFVPFVPAPLAYLSLP
jgi:hypothetical protein